MLPLVINKLNRLNHQFYKTISNEFSETRQQPWDGWKRLIPLIKELPKDISVLDIGCGNGRFLTFLQNNFPSKKIHYTGIDYSQELLYFAQKKFLNLATFQKFDIISENWEKELTKKFDLVVAFGVLHHIPGFAQRKHFLEKCKDVTKKNGMLIFTAWQFAKQKKWEKRFIPFFEIGLQPTEVEENDFLIDWQRGKHAIRYCHHTSQQELTMLLNALPKHTTNLFHADGKTERDNVYCVIQKDEDIT